MYIRRAWDPQNIIAEKSLRTFCEWAVGLLNCNKGCVPGPRFIGESLGMFSWTLPLCRLMAECSAPAMCCAWSTHGPQFNTNTSECTDLWEITPWEPRQLGFFYLRKEKQFLCIWRMQWQMNKRKWADTTIMLKKKKKEYLIVLILKIRYYKVLQASLERFKNQS